MQKAAYWLVWIGGINWGLIGLFNFNLVAWLGLGEGFERLVYVLVGLSALYMLWGMDSMKKMMK